MVDGMKSDFERTWQTKLGQGITESASVDLREHILQSGEALSDHSDRSEVIEWTRDTVGVLIDSCTNQAVQNILTGCACHYPANDLESLKELYRKTKDIPLIHESLREKFVVILRELGLEQGEIAWILDQGWGLAGVLEDDILTATKIPKSQYLKDYLLEDDPERRRALYCHCPRIRDAVKLNMPLQSTYCYCGAGFYQNLWETILERDVEVEVISSVVAGDETCTFQIRLPPASME